MTPAQLPFHSFDIFQLLGKIILIPLVFPFIAGRRRLSGTVQTSQAGMWKTATADSGLEVRAPGLASPVPSLTVNFYNSRH